MHIKNSHVQPYDWERGTRYGTIVFFTGKHTLRERALQNQEKECCGDGKSCVSDNF